MSLSRSRQVLVIGAHKCGTSSLFQWLSVHPEIIGSRPKETHFFVDAESPFVGPLNVHRDGPEAFDTFFPAGAREDRVLLEASTHNLYQSEAPGTVAGCCPGAIVVALVRDPGARVLSSFRWSTFDRGTVDRALSFSEYVDHLLAGDLRPIRGAFSLDRAYWTLSREIDFSRYVVHLQRWADVIPSERLLVLRFVDLRDEPTALVGSVCRALDLDTAAYERFDFGARNRTRAARLPGVHSGLRRWTARVPRSVLFRLAARLYRMTLSTPPPPTPEDLAAARRITTAVAPDSQYLAERFGLDLGHWELGR